MSWGWIVAAFLIGWLVGVWHSYRRVLRDRRRAEATRRKIAEHFAGQLFQKLEDGDVVKFSVKEGEDGEIMFDQDALDQLLGNKTKH